MKTKLIPFLFLALSAMALGALSNQLADEVAQELATRALRERVNQDLMRGLSAPAESYFAGRAAGYESIAVTNLRQPYTAEFLRGVGEAFTQASELVARAEATGSTAPTIQP